MSLINREALLAEYDRVHVGEPGKARKLIEDAPPIELRCEECEAFNKTRLLIPQPERKKGKWIRITQGAIPEIYMCPFCNRTIKDTGIDSLIQIRYPFCHCGADLRGDYHDL